jgi:acetyl-CoA carboxylase biotin carboxyl carrier protein
MSKARATKPVKKEAAASRASTTNPSDMKTSEIRDLIDFIAQSGLNEVNIETKELKLSVKREPDQKIMKSSTPAVATLPAAQPSTVLAPVITANRVEPISLQPTKTSDIKSPMIGTFYRSGNPESPPFVSVGDKVSKGQTVGVIEAMKLFNEIESEISGTIVKVMVENSQPVEYDQVLFVVEPD